MTPFRVHTGLAAPLARPNVDTDQIIPKQFLKRVERTGFGQFLFYDWRFLPDGEKNSEFELNDARYDGASILIGGKNFGCGSSREHAPWALADYGFRAIIAPSYADIFYNNCFKNGILPIVLPEETVNWILAKAKRFPGWKLTVNLPGQSVSDEEGFSATFEVDAFRKHCLLNGLDDVGLTLQHSEKIADFESRRPTWKKGLGVGA